MTMRLDSRSRSRAGGEAAPLCVLDTTRHASLLTASSRPGASCGGWTAHTRPDQTRHHAPPPPHLHLHLHLPVPGLRTSGLPVLQGSRAGLCQDRRPGACRGASGRTGRHHQAGPNWTLPAWLPAADAHTDLASLCLHEHRQQTTH